MAMERQPGNGSEASALNGLLARTEIYGLDGSEKQDQPYRVETTEYALSQLTDTLTGAPRALVTVVRHRSDDTERGSDVRIEEEAYAYDSQGNVVREEQRAWGSAGGVEQPLLTRSREITYARSSNRYILG